MFGEAFVERVDVVAVVGARVAVAPTRMTRGPSSLTMFSNLISSKIGKAQLFRQIGSCLTEFFQGWSYLSSGIFDEKLKLKKP